MDAIAFPKSSNVLSAAYDHEHRVLAITYKGMRTYTYYGVPIRVWDELRSAPSPGAYINANIRDSYHGEQSERG